MRAAARAAFIDLTVSLEGGYINWMFPDVKGLVSTGFGLLLDPVELALALPWRRIDGLRVTADEIRADFARVKTYPDAPRLGHLSVRGVAQLRLALEDLDHAVEAKIRSNESILRSAFAEYDDWSADAQLGVHSMAWAVGPAFQRGWPKFTAALRAKDFETASVECFMPEEKKIGGLRPRNHANRILFRNAAFALANRLDPDELFYPRDMQAETPAPDSVIVVDQPIVHPRVPLGRDDE